MATQRRSAAAPGRRPKQVGDVVRAELARLLRDDLRSARVFVSVFGPKEQFAKTVDALNHARGRLRSLVGRNCGLRYAPELHFAEDHTLERGARIEELLRSIPKLPGEPDVS
ncbi:MAG: 30S ribosome-binding factor RbfA [Thermoanaerobaculia bacterium]